MKKEIWKDIEGYEGIYQISSMGRVKSLERIIKCGRATKILKETILKTVIGKNGYVYVGLSKNGKHKMFLLHRIVGMTFPEICGVWFEGCEIDHQDCNRENNCVSNLKVVTRLENANNPLTIKKHREHYYAPSKGKIGKENHRSKPIIQFTKTWVPIKYWDSVTQAANENNISTSHICECCQGKLETYKGYKWQYLNDYLANWLEAFQDEYMEKEKAA